VDCWEMQIPQNHKLIGSSVIVLDAYFDEGTAPSYSNVALFQTMLQRMLNHTSFVRNIFPVWHLSLFRYHFFFVWSCRMVGWAPKCLSVIMWPQCTLSLCTCLHAVVLSFNITKCMLLMYRREVKPLWFRRWSDWDLPWRQDTKTSFSRLDALRAESSFWWTCELTYWLAKCTGHKIKIHATQQQTKDILR
jgi:hypothetical protein